MNLDMEMVLSTMAEIYHRNLTVVKAPFHDLELFDYGLRKAIDPEYDFQQFGRKLLEKMENRRMVGTTDALDCKYLLFALPDKPGQMYIFGPVISSALSQDIQDRIRREYGTEVLKNILDYYQSIRIQEDTAYNRQLLEKLYASAYPDKDPGFCVEPDFFPMPLLTQTAKTKSRRNLDQLSHDLIEEKYRAEAQLMNAIARGDTQQATEILLSLEKYAVSEIIRSPVTNMKNETLSFNAMCKLVVGDTQKVHPQYTEVLYTSYIKQIEQVDNLKKMRRVIRQMVKDYCSCVNEHSLAEYSQPIQRVINYIHLHTEENLSLKQLAQMYNFSASYLSDLFRRETGSTLTEYINHYRVEKAAALLRYSDKSIAQIGESVGFLDENYFTRIFKKIKGITPSAYRRNEQHT